MKHGHRPRDGKTIEYTSWQSMKARCLNPKHVRFHRYGGAGIKIDPRWIASFTSFLEDVGPCPIGCNSIDRKDSSGDYTKSNMQWANAKQQAHNRTNNVNVKVNGVSMCLAEACRQTGIKYTTAKRRLERGVPNDHLFAPVGTF